MKLNITAFILWCPVAFVARTQVAYQAHCPHDGDRVMKTAYEWLDMPSDTTVWDMSHVVETGESREMRWRVIGDSLLTRVEGGTQHHYRLRGDTLWLMGSENRLTQLRDSVPSAAMRYPLMVGDTLHTPFYYHGRYSGNNAVATAGWSIVEAVAVGTLILPADTVRGVLLVQDTRTSRVRVSPFAEADAISFGSDSLLHHVERLRWWYAPSYRYPLAESRESVFLSGAAEQRRSRSLHLCCPAVQEYALGVMPNEVMCSPVEASPLRFGGHGFADASSAAALSGVLEVREQGDAVEVAYTPDEDCRVEMVLTDALGRVYAARSPHSVQAGACNVGRLSTAGLPAGVYLLYVGNGQQREVKRINVE
ncbi:MAG: T9SS type A sorting domain-containing protein [Muribaculaceae bacterium]|nr:T9SS type A sorting domain-containing protein [Muribaculaceae bacterium]